jgi:hypothetical protein
MHREKPHAHVGERCPQSRLRPRLGRGRALQRSGLLIMRGLMGVATYGACVYDYDAPSELEPMQPSAAGKPSPPRAAILNQLTIGCLISQAVYVVATLGIADWWLERRRPRIGWPG